MKKSIKIIVHGVNLVALIREVQKQNIEADFTRISDTKLEIEIKKSNKAVLIALLEKKCYNYSVEEKNQNNFYFSLGLILGASLLSIAFIIFSQFCWKAEVVCSSSLIRTEIEKELKNNNILGSSWGKINFTQLEKTLMTNIPSLGLVNVSRKGMYLIINTIENEPRPEDTITPNSSSGIFADREGIISRIFVVNGTPLVKVGDSVSLGQMLVAPYSLTPEGEQIASSVKADVYIYSWSSATVEFEKTTTEFAPTGKRVEKRELILFNKVISTSSPKVDFANYKTTTTTSHLSSVLPLYLKITYYQETTPVEVERDFDAEREALIFEAKEKVMTGVNFDNVLEERHTINKVGEKHFVTYYIKQEFKIKG